MSREGVKNGVKFANVQIWWSCIIHIKQIFTNQIFRINNMSNNMTVTKLLKTKIVPKFVVEVVEKTLLTMVKIGDYRCTICDVPMRGPDSIIVQHFGGKKHRM